MKFFYLTLFIFLSAIGSAAQTSPANLPDTLSLKIVQKKWSVKNQREIRESSKTQTPVNYGMGGRGGIPVGSQTQARKTSVPVGFTKKIFVYEVLFRNDDEKAVRRIVWDYVFYDPETKREIGRRTFASKTKISPDSEKRVVAKLSEPPIKSLGIKVIKQDEGLSDLYIEEIEIKSVEYADGTTWEAAL